MPLVQLSPHSLISLPRHPDLVPCRPVSSIQEQIRDVLQEAHEILASLPSELKAETKLRKSFPSDAKVQLSQGWRTPLRSEPNAQKEYWVCRESEHVDSNCGNGSATWQEFQNGLHHDHARNEQEYTPTVTRVVNLFDWTNGEEEHLGQPFEIGDTRYSHFDAKLNLIVHHFKPDGLIQPRAFVSLTISAATMSLAARDPQNPETRQATEGFVTVQVPYQKFNDNFPSDKFITLYAKIDCNVPHGVIFGNYASVERVELLVLPRDRSGSVVSTSASTAGDNIGQTKTLSSISTSAPVSTDRRVKWTMATTSDAAGDIPGWVQRSWILGGVPKAVVADVGLFIGWVAQRRGRLVSRREEGEA
ncbi:uncharacterized protein N7511_008925 [Penicillium nucicola]|uniref:uncharacterized protein n=1 Tax=Penicillium nucicola TaxID=1850975 RepID=UPI002545507B|nr:uncharacterized protein N7511_008925 [Penicillium nucicola]KAJ5747229.1 hypothetical protein N7511_008925 [Penicillium nucicola]